MKKLLLILTVSFVFQSFAQIDPLQTNDSIAQNGKTIKVQSLLEDNYVDASGY